MPIAGVLIGRRRLATASLMLLTLGVVLPAQAESDTVRNGPIAYSVISSARDGAEGYRVHISRPDGRSDRSVRCTRPLSGTCYDQFIAFSPTGRRLAVLTGGSDSESERLAVLTASGRLLRGFKTGESSDWSGLVSERLRPPDQPRRSSRVLLE